MKIINSIGIDPGNGFMKMKSGNKEVHEPMLQAKIKRSEAYNDYSNVLEQNERKYLFGEDARKFSTSSKGFIKEDNKARFDKDFVEFILAFVYKNFVDDGSNKVKIKNMVIGVPNVLSDSRQELKELFEKPKYNIVIDSKSISFDLETVDIVPQPLGTFFSSTKYLKPNVCIVDIGFGTVDYTFVRNGKVADSFATDEGFRKLLLEYKKDIEAVTSLNNPSPHEILEIVRTGKVKEYGKEKKIDLKSLELLKEDYFDDIVIEITERETLAKFDLVLFTGGVSNEYKDNVEELIKSTPNVVFVENPQMANVKGFEKIAKSRK